MADLGFDFNLSSRELTVKFGALYSIFYFKDAPSFNDIRKAIEKRFGIETYDQRLNSGFMNVYTYNPGYVLKPCELTLKSDPKNFDRVPVIVARRRRDRAKGSSLFICTANVTLFQFKVDVNTTVGDIKSFLRSTKEYSLVCNQYNDFDLMYKEMCLQNKIVLIDLFLDYLDCHIFSIKLYIPKSNGHILLYELELFKKWHAIEILSPQQIAKKKDELKDAYDIPTCEQIFSQLYCHFCELICYNTEDSSLIAKYREFNIPMLKPVKIVSYDTGETLLTINLKDEQTLDIHQIVRRRLNPYVFDRSKQVLVTRNLQRCCHLTNFDLIRLNIQTKDPFLFLYLTSDNNKDFFEFLEPYSGLNFGEILWIPMPKSDSFEITIRFLTSQIQIDIGKEQLSTVACLKTYLFEWKHISVHLQQIMHNGEELDNGWALRRLTKRDDVLTVIFKPDATVTLHLCGYRRIKYHEVAMKETSTLGDLKEVISQFSTIPATSISFDRFEKKWRPNNLELWQIRFDYDRVIVYYDVKKKKKCVLL